jgi:predicted trehalose synthase
MAKVAGAIDNTVKMLETIIQMRPTFKFQNAAGKEIPIRDLAGLARSVQAATSIRQGASLDEGDVRSLEQRLATMEADVKAMLTQLSAIQSV